jgi:hypothetical protein
MGDIRTIFVGLSAFVATGALIWNISNTRKVANRAELSKHFDADVCVPVYEALADFRREWILLGESIYNLVDQKDNGGAADLLQAAQERKIAPIQHELAMRINGAISEYKELLPTLYNTVGAARETDSALEMALVNFEEGAVDRMANAIASLLAQLRTGSPPKLDFADVISARIFFDNSVRAAVNELRSRIILGRSRRNVLK